MEQAKRIAKNTGFLYARMAITVFISLYVTRLVLDALGVEDFGIFNLIGGIITLLSFLNAGMASATQRFMSYAQGQGDVKNQKNIFNISIRLHFVIGILIVVFLEVAGYFLFDSILEIPLVRIPAAKSIFHFMVLSSFFSVLSVPYNAVIYAHENMFFVALLGILEAILKLGIAIYITQTSFDKLISFGLLMAILSVIMLIIRQVYCHGRYNEVEIHIKKRYERDLFLDMTGFAGWSFLGSSTSLLANYGQGIIINMFFGPILNASQGIAAQVNGQLGAFAGTMLNALKPVIAKNEGAGQRGTMLQTSLMGSKISFFLLGFFYAPVLIEMPFIFNLWLKEVPPYALIFCRLLLVRSLIDQVVITLVTSISAVGVIKNFQIYSAILNLLPLLVTYILYSFNFPPQTIYIVFIFYTILNATIITVFAKKHCGLSIKFFLTNTVLRCFISFIFILSLSVVPSYFISEGIMRLIFTLVISTISFIIIVWLIGFSSSERKEVEGFIMLAIKSIRG